jgi:hypothetical protein
LATSPKKKGRFDQKLPDVYTGELHVPPAVQTPVHDMEDVGQGDDDDEGVNLRDLNSSADTSLITNGSASLSFGSDTEYSSETYVIVDAEVKGRVHWQ